MTDRKEDLNCVNSCTVPGPDQKDESRKNNCEMPSGLRCCVHVIHQIFRSVDYSPITKQELVFKILVSSFDVEERGVVEEHLEQLELILPSWISKRISPNGDLMYSIKRLPDVSALLSGLKKLGIEVGALGGVAPGF